ncbi:MAG: glucosidase [Flavisolibacter sp.]
MTNGEGNHGEDVKELYYYLDNLPSHFYMKYLYKYPQNSFPYELLINENKKRSRLDTEYELLDSGVFDNNQYFDVYIEYAKKNSEDIFIQIEIINQFHETASLTVLPTLWFYNRWSYGGLKIRPTITRFNSTTVRVEHERLGIYYLNFDPSNGSLFTENETNNEKLFGKPNLCKHVKDAFHNAIIEGENLEELKNLQEGTKFAPIYHFSLEAGASKKILLRLSKNAENSCSAPDSASIFNQRKNEADQFYKSILGKETSDIAIIKRQAFAGLLWNKQYYHLDNERWLNNSDGITPFSQTRRFGRNSDWKYLKNQDIICMPDKWEYPWYASWDTAFHCISMSLVDPAFAKHQLLLMMREWYMNPEGQLPAYEWNFNDVNPPVHALAALEVYYVEKQEKGLGDIEFLKRIFQKLIINFTWWANRKDLNGNNIFEGGFLGLDNIGIFNRIIKLHNELQLEQADATSWMGMYALNMMAIAVELAIEDRAFEDAATKFYEHFVLIAEALNELGLWNEEDNFFYDVLCLNGLNPVPLKIRSIVGLIPLFAVCIINKEQLAILKEFKKRMEWFKNYRNENSKYLPSEQKSDQDDTLLSLVHRDRLLKILQRLFDPQEFLSPNGIRAVSKYYENYPFSLLIADETYSIQYDPGDSTSALYGGNSNWRGPIWMPINYLLIKALQKYGQFYGDELQVEYPLHSGRFLSLKQITDALSENLLSIFMRDETGQRKVFGPYNWFYQKEENKNLVLYHEYFHGDNGRGLGASHQTGWTALVANLL